MTLTSISAGARAWAALALTMALAALAARALPAQSVDWQPALAWREPWRAFSAAAVHLSPLHLLGGLTAAALVGAYGVAARVPLAQVLAWLAAWPLTQFGLLLRPEITHFGGLSGVMHAGVAVVSMHLLLAATGRQRAIGGAVLAGAVLKVLSESPWGEALRHPSGWDIAVVPYSHATGLVAGLVCALAAHGATSRRTSPSDELR